MVVLVATVAYFIMAIIALIAYELAGLQYRHPGVGTLITLLAFFFVMAIVVIAHELGALCHRQGLRRQGR